MKTPEKLRHRQQSEVFAALLLFILVLVLIQLWLFVSVLEYALAHGLGMSMPAAITSVIILGINVWMLRGISHMEKSR